MKQIYFLFFIFIFISSAYAFNLTSGESLTFNVEEEFEYYEVVGNSTTMDYITITSEGTNITIKTELLASPDTFTLVFFNEKEVVKVVNVGGSSGGIIYRNKIVNNTIFKEVEKIVKVEDKEEIDRLLGIANNAIKKENKFKILFIVTISMITIILIIKIKNLYKNE